MARHIGEASAKNQGPGYMEIGITDDGFVAVQFHDPEWWLNLTPNEARTMANLLVKKAAEVEACGG